MKRMKYYVYSTMSNTHRRQVSRSKPAAVASYKYIKQQKNEYTLRHAELEKTIVLIYCVSGVEVMMIADLLSFQMPSHETWKS